MNDQRPPASRVLIVDDEPTAVQNLAHVCRKAGHLVTTATSGSAALDALQRQAFDLVLTDLRMEQVDGMAVLARARELDAETAVILITGHATLDSAVRAMRAGAFHYIAKPFRLDEVREVVRNALEMVRLKRENRLLRQQLNEGADAPVIITQNAAMQRLLETARRIGPSDTTVLISGHSGTGKELLARYVHAHSRRSAGPFLAVNCGALQEELLANELFGHEKGAYTGATEARKGLVEAAQGGTLFLDEIAEMSLAMQVKLLRVIQEREVQRLGATQSIPVDIRLIAATHRDLPEEVAAGRFRQDLYYRLDVVGLQLPALAERRDDIALLAYHFLRKHAARMDRRVQEIAPEALAALQDHDFPGNIRELENLVERAVTLTRGDRLGLPDLPLTLLERSQRPAREQGQRCMPTLATVELDYIRQVLEHCENNRTKAARILGIDRVSLWRKLKRYGMENDAKNAD